MHIGPITQVLISVAVQTIVYDRYKQQIHQHLNILPLGVKRLVIVTGVILLFVLLPLLGPDGIINGLLEALAFGIPIYFVLTMLGVWVYEGFRK